MKIAVILLSILSLSFMISYIAVFKRLQLLTQEFAQLFLTNVSLQETLDARQSFDLSDNDQDIHKENFIKFLSDSRDWAYEYIEHVQEELQKFIGDVEPHLNHFDNYGDVLSDKRPDYVAMKQISKSFKQLKDLLPKENNDRR